jgi:hypothetical protein
MGYMRHHAIVCTSWNEEHIVKAHKKATTLFEDMTSDVSREAINGYRSFAVFPDGSKEGWLESDQGDQLREKFLAWLVKSELYVAWVEVQFGDNEREAKVVNASDWQERD